MKSRLNITVENELAEQAKSYADAHGTSVSNLVEQYFKSLTRPLHKKNILDLLKDLPKPSIMIEGSDKETYYHQQKRSMASKVFLDANFLLDLTLQREGFQYSREILQLAISSRIRLFTTPAVLLRFTLHKPIMPNNPNSWY